MSGLSIDQINTAKADVGNVLADLESGMVSVTGDITVNGTKVYGGTDLSFKGVDPVDGGYLFDVKNVTVTIEVHSFVGKGFISEVITPEPPAV